MNRKLMLICNKRSVKLKNGKTVEYLTPYKVSSGFFKDGMFYESLSSSKLENYPDYYLLLVRQNAQGEQIPHFLYSGCEESKKTAKMFIELESNYEMDQGLLEQTFEALKSDGYFVEKNDVTIVNIHEAERQIASIDEETKKDDLPDIEKVEEQMKKTIIAQDEAIQMVLTKLYSNLSLRDFDDEVVDISKYKANLLLIGPTGSGKTEIIRQLGKQLKLPIVTVDCTKYTQAGYEGSNVDEIAFQLLEAANGDLAKAEHGIVYLDEIDKLADRKGGDIGVSTKAVQQALLKIIEGGLMTFERGQERLTMDTSGVTFIGGGSFDGIEEIRKERSKEKRKIGFSTEETKKKETGYMMEDFIAFGMIPELMGRLPVYISLKELTLEDLKQILTRSVDSPLYLKKILFRMRNINLSYQEQVIEAIAKEAYRYHMGARSLKTVVERMFSDAEFRSHTHKGKYKTLEVTTETVADNKRYVLK